MSFSIASAFWLKPSTTLKVRNRLLHISALFKKSVDKL